MTEETRKKQLNPKVAAAGIGGAVTTVLIWGATAAGIEIPAEVAAAIATIIAFGAGYLKTGITS